MKIAIHYTEQEHKDSFSKKWAEELKKRGSEVLTIDFRCSDIIQKVKGCDGVMWHWFHNPNDKQSAPKILAAIESVIGIPAFPNFSTRWHYDEKIAQHYLLDALDVPKIKTWVFWDYKEAINFLKRCKFPIVFKLSVGASSANVSKFNNFKQAKLMVDQIFKFNVVPYTYNEFKKNSILGHPKQLLRRIYDSIQYIVFEKYPRIHYFHIQKNYAYFQEYIPNNAFDIRITVIGNRAFGFTRYNREGNFRASGSGIVDYNIKKIPLECVKIAYDISAKNNFQSMAYDFLISEDEKPLVNEISYCFVNHSVYGCAGYWDSNLNWHEGPLWPEEAHVEDFINLINKNKK